MVARTMGSELELGIQPSPLAASPCCGLPGGPPAPLCWPAALHTLTLLQPLSTTLTLTLVKCFTALKKAPGTQKLI